MGTLTDTRRMKPFRDRIRKPHERWDTNLPWPRLGWFNGEQTYPERSAWENILRESTEGNRPEISKVYLDAVDRVKYQAQEIYTDSRDFSSERMVSKCCYELQLALYSLGGYRPIDRDFLELLDNIKNTFCDFYEPSRQVPLVVLKELMGLPFFRGVVSKGHWTQPKDLAGMILFEFLIIPMCHNSGFRSNVATMGSNFGNLQRRVRNVFRQNPLTLNFSDLQRRVRNVLRQNPPTLLQALWMVFMGTGKPLTFKGNNINDVAEESSCDNRAWPMVRRAMDLRGSGIKFACTNEIGIRGTKFVKKRFEAVLYLSPLWIDRTTLELFRRLIEYEKMVFQDRNKREFCAYFQLMRELIRTPEDVEIIASSSIMFVAGEEIDGLPDTLQEFQLDNTGNAQNALRLNINNYKPSAVVRDFVGLVTLLTIIQTIYTVLGFHLGKH